MMTERIGSVPNGNRRTQQTSFKGTRLSSMLLSYLPFITQQAVKSLDFELSTPDVKLFSLILSK
jgi:hypothetical protein